MSSGAAEGTAPSAVASRSITRRVVGDLPYYALAQLGSSLLNMASVAIFTRLLDRRGYGSYVLVLSAVTVVAELGFGWLQQSALRFWKSENPARPGERDGFLSSLSALFAWALAGSLVVWPLLAPLLLPEVSWLAAAAGFVVLVGQCSIRIIQARTRIHRELKAYFWYTVLPPALGLVLGVALVWRAGAGGTGVLAALAVGYGAVVAIELGRRFRAYIPKIWRPDPQQRALLLRFGFPIMASALAGVALNLSDRFLVAHLFGLSAAGEYAAAFALAIKVDAVAMLFVTSAFPLLVQDYDKGDVARVGADLSRLITVFATFFAPAVCGVALVARPVVALLLGPDFQQAHLLIVPLMPGVFMMGIERYVSKAFHLAGNNRPRMIIIAVAAVLNLGANLLLLPRYGLVAAAWTLSGGWVLVTVTEYVWSRRLLRYQVEWAALGKVALATGVMAAVALLASAGVTGSTARLLVRILVGVTCYAALGFALDLGGIRRRFRKGVA